MGLMSLALIYRHEALIVKYLSIINPRGTICTDWQKCLAARIRSSNSLCADQERGQLRSPEGCVAGGGACFWAAAQFQRAAKQRAR